MNLIHLELTRRRSSWSCGSYKQSWTASNLTLSGLSNSARTFYERSDTVKSPALKAATTQSCAESNSDCSPGGIHQAQCCPRRLRRKTNYGRSPVVWRQCIDSQKDYRCNDSTQKIRGPFPRAKPGQRSGQLDPNLSIQVAKTSSKTQTWRTKLTTIPSFLLPSMTDEPM